MVGTARIAAVPARSQTSLRAGGGKGDVMRVEVKVVVDVEAADGSGVIEGGPAYARKSAACVYAMSILHAGKQVGREGGV